MTLLSPNKGPVKPLLKKKKRKSVDWTGEVMNGKYETGGRVGSGSFADVYEGRTLSSNVRICMKIEDHHMDKVEQEYQVLKRLAGGGFTPDAYEYFQTRKANILVFQLLGHSLDALLKNSQRLSFSINTTCWVAARIMECIQHVHSRGYLHRDIKPHNFVIGRERQGAKLFAIDFGLSKPYVHEGVHIPFSVDQSFIGTARYVSVNTHRGKEQGRRDDLESIAYILIYFLKGKLPWQGVGAKLEKKDRMQMITDYKHSSSVLTLCAGLPQPFAKLLSYAKGLAFTARPDYDTLRDMFQAMYNPEEPLDWESSGLAKQLTGMYFTKKMLVFTKPTV